MLTVPMALSIGSAEPGTARASSGSTSPELDEKIRRIVTRPGFNGSWALRFAYAGSGAPICGWNSAQPLRVASSIKIFIMGTAFEELGPDYGFRTRVYGTGPVRHGVLHGDLVLEAGGDLLLGCRIRPDGTMALPQPDHTYASGRPDAEPLPGDPLGSFRRLAEQVRAKGVRRVTGSVVVDTSLFRQTPEPAGNMPIVASPMMINDNVVDITVTPASRAGRAAGIELSPHTSYVRTVNQVRTVGASDPATRLEVGEDVSRPDGGRVVTLTGALPAGTPSRLFAYHLPDPGRSAEFAFAKTLCEAGVHAEPAPTAGERADEDKAGGSRSLLAELAGLPLSKQVWPMIKVSNNPHAATIPFLIGAIAGKDPENGKAAYERLRGELFAEAGVEPNPPGHEAGKFAPDLFVTFLNHINRKPYIDPLVDALTVVRENEDHPASGHIFAKGGSGTWPAGDDGVEIHHALAGYVKPPGRERSASPCSPSSSPHPIPRARRSSTPSCGPRCGTS